MYEFFHLLQIVIFSPLQVALLLLTYIPIHSPVFSLFRNYHIFFHILLN